MHQPGSKHEGALAPITPIPAVEQKFKCNWSVFFFLVWFTYKISCDSHAICEALHALLTYWWRHKRITKCHTARAIFSHSGSDMVVLCDIVIYSCMRCHGVKHVTLRHPLMTYCWRHKQYYFKISDDIFHALTPAFNQKLKYYLAPFGITKFYAKCCI